MEFRFSLSDLLAHAATELVRAHWSGDENQVILWRQTMSPAVSRQICQSVALPSEPMNPYAHPRLSEVDGAAWVNVGGQYRFLDRLTELESVRMFVVLEGARSGQTTWISQQQEIFDSALVAQVSANQRRREDGKDYVVHAIAVPVAHLLACQGIFFQRHSLYPTSPIETAPVQYAEGPSRQRLDLKTCSHLIAEAIHRRTLIALDIEQTREQYGIPF